ncbi:hypothetical protein E3E12_00360 [Formicincola oecophyllae]|uniref:3-deoxy-D-manno-octulosonic acid transferase n=1 Tax=Formicincola oecophyllae TaxID=2558361 RepID=A0A4Y6U6D5_9PROT|nr:glycosyltransferase N-terminal domain-containing protein [Formicincola oecophyllae]QDH12909.1 hypothetical protein E3E12_00360 [Formicincola oecophyllae]
MKPVASPAPTISRRLLGHTPKRVVARLLAGVSQRHWQVAGLVLRPLLLALLAGRLLQGRESLRSLKERLGWGGGKSLLAQGDGPLLWCHGASVGEVTALLPILDTLLGAHPTLNVLVTTATLNGQACAERALGHHNNPAPNAACHKACRHKAGKRFHTALAPWDVASWVGRFLRHWHPSALLLVENEIWPTTLGMVQAHNVPVLMVNARLSARSAKRWSWLPGLISPALAAMAWVQPATQPSSHRLRSLGAGRLLPAFNLKAHMPPPPAAPEQRAFFKRACAGRHVIVALSTHGGEEVLLARAAAWAAGLKKGNPQALKLLLVLVPRHPKRGPALAKALQAPLHSRHEVPKPDQNLWIVDSMGQTGAILRAAQAVIMGNTWTPQGQGHNVHEPLSLGLPVLVGPWLGAWGEVLDPWPPNLHQVGGAWVHGDTARSNSANRKGSSPFLKGLAHFMLHPPAPQAADPLVGAEKGPGVGALCRLIMGTIQH